MSGKHIQIAELSDSLLEVREANGDTVFLLERVGEFRCPSSKCHSKKIFRVKEITFRKQKLGGPSKHVFCFNCGGVFEIQRIEIQNGAFWKKIIEIQGKVVSDDYGNISPIDDLEI